MLILEFIIFYLYFSPYKMDTYEAANRPEEDPYMGDENTYQEHFRKTFITENQKEGEAKEAWTLHDMLIPAGNTAKLARIPDPTD